MQRERWGASVEALLGPALPALDTVYLSALYARENWTQAGVIIILPFTQEETEAHRDHLFTVI